MCSLMLLFGELNKMALTLTGPPRHLQIILVILSTLPFKINVIY